MFLNALVYMVENQSNTSISLDTWFNFFGTITGALIGGAIAFFIAKTQIEEQSIKDREREKRGIAQKLKLDTYLELNNILREYEKEVMWLYANIAHYEVGNMSLEEYNNKHFEANEIMIPSLIRKILGLRIVVPEIIDKHDVIRDVYSLFSSMVYYKYKNKNEFIEDLISEDTSEEEKAFFEELNTDYLENDNQTITDYLNAHNDLVQELLEDIQNKIELIIK